MKAIHVELSDEGGIVLVLKEFRYQGPREFILVYNDERVTLVRPANEFGISILVEETMRSQRSPAVRDPGRFTC